jgi:hypothetical protein
VALGWLWGAYQLAINRLCGGFDVALVWLELTFCGFSFQPFSISAFARVWLWVARAVSRRYFCFLVSVLCFLLAVALPGCSRFEVQGSGFKVPCPP